MTNLIDALGSRVAALLWFARAAGRAERRARPRCGDIVWTVTAER